MFKLNETYSFKSPNHRAMWLEANKATNDLLIANSIMDNLFTVTEVDKDGDVTEIRLPSGQVLHADELDYSYLLYKADFKYFRKGGLNEKERETILADLQKQIDAKLDEVFLLHTEIKKLRGK